MSSATTAQTSLRFIVQLRQNDVNTVSYFLVWRLYCLIRSTSTVVIVCVKAKPRNGAQRCTTVQRHTTAPLCRCAVVRRCVVSTDRLGSVIGLGIGFGIGNLKKYLIGGAAGTVDDCVR